MSSSEIDPLAIVEQTRQAISTKDPDQALSAVTGLIVELGLGDHAGVTRRHGQRGFDTVGATGQIVLEADRLQYELREGPCVDASYQDGILSSADVAHDERWPRWGPAAGELGVAATLSVHLYAGDRGMGALNIYTTQPREFTQEELDWATFVGANASIALSHLNREEHMWKAIDARHSVGVAQGILCHQLNISVEQALALMMRVSRDKGIKVQHLAAEIVRLNNAKPLTL